MADKAPAYQWYPKDYDTDEAVKLMTYEQEGIYRRLLDHQWLHGSIPSDPQQIAGLVPKVARAKFLKLWPGISAKFVDCEASRLFNRRMEKQRGEQSDFHGDKRAGGIASAAARREKFGSAQPKAVRTGARTDHRTATEQPVRTASRTGPEPSSSSASASATASPKRHVPRGEFDLFWDTYPKKVGKDAARKVWLRRASGLPPIGDLVLAIEQQAASAQWQQNGGQYIPNPATWLSQGRWQDETEAAGLIFSVSDKSRQNMANAPEALRLIAENEHARQR